MTTIERFFGSHINTGLLIMRILVGAIFFAHGIQKFNMGIANVAGFFTQAGIPAALLVAWLVTLLETFGGLALIIGVCTRLTALLLGIAMIAAAIICIKMGLPFISTQSIVGYELNFSLFAALTPILILGPGRYSLAKYILRKESEQVQ